MLFDAESLSNHASQKQRILVVILCYVLSIVLREFWMNESKYIVEKKYF